MTKLAHSYSSIKLYDNCPLRYYRQRVLKDVVDEGGVASKYGERIHSQLEHYLLDRTRTTEIAPYIPLCDAFIALASVDNRQLHVEKELVLTEELKASTWDAPNAWFRSKLDILILGTTEAIVGDWKTGKRNTDTFQMEVFAAQVFKHYPYIDRVTTSLIWLKSMQMDTAIYYRTQHNELWAGVMNKIRRIHQSLEHDNWQARPSGLCNYCPAKHDCEYARV